MKIMGIKIAILGLLLLVVYSFFIIGFGLFSRPSKADVCVVLGNKIAENGTPSDRLRARLDKAVELYTKKYFNKIIVSGGYGKEGFKEAEVMRLYLLEHGVSDHCIIVDNNGNNTALTAQFTVDYMTRNNYKSVVVVSQYFHLLRTRLMLNKLGAKNVTCAGPLFFELRDVYSIPREMIGILKYGLLF
jgi:vancomycin permeability regulator SanA